MEQSYHLAEPLIHVDQPIFTDFTEVSLELRLKSVEIFYTLDGSEPDRTKNLYTGPIRIEESCELKARAFMKGWKPSSAAIQDFIKVKYRAVGAELDELPSQRYSGNGAASLIDLRSGGPIFASGHWLGFEARNMAVVIDFGEELNISEVLVGCLRDHSSWIFLPKDITVYHSTDKQSFKKTASITEEIPAEQQRPAPEFMRLTFPAVKARYIRVEISNISEVPEWHPGSGGKAWLFVDEIMVN